MKINKKAIITICILAAAAAISGCGKKSAPDAASSQVIQISVAPEETTPTPAPDQIDSSAITTNGNLTMVNEYLAENGGAELGSAAVTPTPAAAASDGSTGDSESDTSGADTSDGDSTDGSDSGDGSDNSGDSGYSDENGDNSSYDDTGEGDYDGE